MTPVHHKRRATTSGSLVKWMGVPVVSLAGDRTRLGALRGDLRARMERSGLTDAKAFTEKLEAAYRRMWRHWCARRNGR